MTKIPERERAHAGRRVDLGVGGLYAVVGDHIGHFYRSKAEWKAVLVPFLGTGLRTGNKCVYVATSEVSQKEIQDGLEANGIDVGNAVTSGQLVFDKGGTTPEELQDRLNSAIAEIPNSFELLRWGGDMTWSLRKMPNSETLMEWETHCNIIADPPAIFLCQYDLTQFMGHVVLDALKTHPLCIVGNTIHENPYYERPEVFLEEIRGRPLTQLHP